MRILVVEDNPTNLAVLVSVISRIPECTVEGLTQPILALQKVREVSFDLCVIDHQMPGMTGTELIRALRALEGYRSVPLIMVTADDDRKVRVEAVEAGATDFLTKPLNPVELRARVQNLLALRKAQNDLANRAEDLSSQVKAATGHLQDREEEMIWRLARAIEYRDGGTGEHISRVAQISYILARGVGLSEAACRLIYLAAPLHDIGKIAIPDAILRKPASLAPDEYQTMQTHVEIGQRILADGTSDLVRVAETIAASHHERWDGKGYPTGRAGEDIPIEGRIVAIADVFDALCTARPYKPAWPIERARAEILANRGTHFDPICVDAFDRLWPEIKQTMGSVVSSAVA